jgi:Ca-activated chloride channel family protein
MSFEWPYALLGLALLPALAALYVFVQRRRRAYAVRFTNLALLGQVVGRRPGFRRHVPPLLFLLGLAALLISLARPNAEITVPREQATVMLVMDVSGSMDATDVQPNRLAAAKDAAGRFLDEIPAGVQVGVVSFESNARTVAQPTRDRTLVRNAVGSLRASGGTAMGDAIVEALEASSGQPTENARGGQDNSNSAASTTPGEERVPTVILLLSDGTSTTGRTQPLDAAETARETGVPVFTIALGTPTGSIETRSGSRIQRQRVPPDPETLREVAETTGGRFFEAPSSEDLRGVYEELASRVGFVTEEQEVTALFAAAGATLMLVGGVLSMFWFARLP